MLISRLTKRHVRLGLPECRSKDQRLDDGAGDLARLIAEVDSASGCSESRSARTSDHFSSFKSSDTGKGVGKLLRARHEATSVGGSETWRRSDERGEKSQSKMRGHTAGGDERLKVIEQVGGAHEKAFMTALSCLACRRRLAGPCSRGVRTSVCHTPLRADDAGQGRRAATLSWAEVAGRRNTSMLVRLVAVEQRG